MRPAPHGSSELPKGLPALPALGVSVLDSIGFSMGTFLHVSPRHFRVFIVKEKEREKEKKEERKGGEGRGEEERGKKKAREIRKEKKKRN